MNEIVATPAVSVERVRTTGMPTAVWPIGLAVGLSVLVAMAVGSPAQDIGAPWGEMVAASTDEGGALPIATPGLPASTAPVVLLIPEAGRALSGTSIPVAGVLAPPKRRPGSTGPKFVWVVIRDGDLVLGDAAIPVASGVFAGRVCVVDLPKGSRVRITVALTTDAGRDLASVPFVLAASSRDIGPSMCDAGTRDSASTAPSTARAYPAPSPSRRE